jgi:hypothetical protein
MMPNPLSPLNGQNQALEGLIGDDGVQRIKRGAGDYVPVGAVDHSADTTVQVVTVGSSGALGLARTPDVFVPFSALDVSSEADVWVPTSGKRFRLMGFVITQGTLTGDVTLKDGTGLATILTVPATPVGQPLTVNLGSTGILSGAVNRHLTATGVSTETISGFVWGVEE